MRTFLKDFRYFACDKIYEILFKKTLYLSSKVRGRSGISGYFFPDHSCLVKTQKLSWCLYNVYNTQYRYLGLACPWRALPSASPPPCPLPAVCVLLLWRRCLPTGVAMEFATHMFKSWLEQKDLQHISTTLKRAGLQGTLLVGPGTKCWVVALVVVGRIRISVKLKSTIQCRIVHRQKMVDQFRRTWVIINLFGPDDAIWHLGSWWSTLVQVMLVAWQHQAISWTNVHLSVIINEVLQQSTANYFTGCLQSSKSRSTEYLEIKKHLNKKCTGVT